MLAASAHAPTHADAELGNGVSCLTTEPHKPEMIKTPEFQPPRIGNNVGATAGSLGFISELLGSARSLFNLGGEACTTVANGDLCEEDKSVTRAGNTVYITKV